MVKNVMKYIMGRITKLYNSLISTSWINNNNKICRRLRGMLYHNICHEYEAYFGERNPDRLFYVIRCSKSDLGFMGLYNHVVWQIELALSRGAIPVVDCRYYPNDYLLEDSQVGKVNGWEFFFLQPTEVSLEEVYESKNVIMGAGGSYACLSKVYDDKKLLQSHHIVEQYMKLNLSVREVCEKEAEKLGFSGNRIMGVKCRGSDFVSAHPKGHSIPPNAQQTIDKIEELTKEWGEFDYIFVATEDEHIFESLKEYYGEKLIYNETKRLSLEEVKGKWLNELFDSPKTEDGYKYVRMLEYLVSVWLLAKCDALVAPVVGGTLSAMEMKGKYEHVYLFDLGIYD